MAEPATVPPLQLTVPPVPALMLMLMLVLVLRPVVAEQERVTRPASLLHLVQMLWT